MLSEDDPVAVMATQAVHSGDLGTLRGLLAAHPDLARDRIGSADPGMSRTLLHAVTDWPGHYPRVAETIAVLIEAGADVDARFRGPHEETPLHWAASSDDVAALDALLDAGADIEAPGAVLGGGSPLADARGFKQWRVAFRLVERGARTTLIDAATMGLADRLPSLLDEYPDDLGAAFWGACHGGRLACAQFLLERGADLDWLAPWEPMTPLDAALRDQADDLVAWLRDRGARRAADL